MDYETIWNTVDSFRREPVKPDRKVKLYAIGQGSMDLFNKALMEAANKHDHTILIKTKEQYPMEEKQLPALEDQIAEAEAKAEYKIDMPYRKISSTKGKYPSNLQPAKKKRKKKAKY